MNTECVTWFSLQLPSETFLILGPNERGIIVDVHRFACKISVFLSDFNETWIFSTDFRKIIKYQITWKSVRWEMNCFMWTDRRTAMMKPIVGFRNSVISCISAMDAFFFRTRSAGLGTRHWRSRSTVTTSVTLPRELSQKPFLFHEIPQTQCHD